MLSWPSAEAGTLPVESGVAVAFAREIAAAADPEQRRLELEAQFAKGLTPFPGAEALSVHDLIRPDETRKEVRTAAYNCLKDLWSLLIALMLQLCGWLDRVQDTIPRIMQQTAGKHLFGYRG